MQPKVPIETSIQFIWGYIGQEPDDVQFIILSNLLMRFLLERVPAEDHRAALQAIMDSLPVAALVNSPHLGGMQ
jgi:hypothetical protein